MLLNAFTLGSGQRPVVLLHGFLGSGKNLRTLAQRWSEQDPSRVFLLPDLRGHGESPPAGDDTDLRAMGADVLETARANGLQGPLELVGHSLGGRVSLAASLVAPQEVGQVVLLDITPSKIRGESSDVGKVLEVVVSAPDQAGDRRELRGFLTDHGLPGHLADWLMMNVDRDDDGIYRWRFDRQALSRLHARVNAEELWEAVEQLGSRARCIRGGRSRYLPDEDAQRLRALGCRVDTLEGVGHFVHVEGLEPLLRLLTGPEREVQS